MTGPYSIIYADPPWDFKVWYQGGWRNTPGGRKFTKGAPRHYDTMDDADLAALPVKEWCEKDSVLFMWTCWPMLQRTFPIIEAWGFTYKTCAFCWTKANTQQIDMFREDADPRMGMGYWTRANSEVCLLATRGKPKRKSASVRQAIIEPLREHSRKPDCVPDRIVQLCGDLPRLEMFARTRREGWDAYGNQIDKFAGAA